MISIVYYAYVKEDGPWKEVIFGQIDDLVRTGLTSIAQVYICLTSYNQHLTDICKKYILSRIPNAQIWVNKNNLFEYPGINKIWDLAHKNNSPDHYILYFHTKGVTHSNRRSKLEKKLFEVTIDNWREVQSVFLSKPRVNKIGMFPASLGYIWFNFFWVRASYVSTFCKKPIETQIRHSYEQWLLSKQKANCNDCYSLFNQMPRKSYDPVSAMRLLSSACKSHVRRNKTKF